eukprot:5219992-Alexandrium_andersonii.AAC.1
MTCPLTSGARRRRTSLPTFLLPPAALPDCWWRPTGVWGWWSCGASASSDGFSPPSPWTGPTTSGAA